MPGWALRTARTLRDLCPVDLKFDALITGAKLDGDSFEKHLGSGFEP